MKKLIDSIKKNEGFRSSPYTDSLGVPTIGYGTKLGISKIEATWLLEHRLEEMITKVDSSLALQKIELSSSVKEALYEMAYNLGVHGLFQFKHMMKALKDKDYELASKEALNSKWATQVGVRAIELASIISKG